MRTLSVRPGHEEQDIFSGRAILQESIAHPSKTVMVVRFHSPEVARFADKAATRSDPFPWRETVWVTDRRIFAPGQEAELFNGHDGACGVALDLRDRPVVWLAPDATPFAIDRAFRQAETGTAA
jgi:hypothetical protein